MIAVIFPSGIDMPTSSSACLAPYQKSKCETSTTGRIAAIESCVTVGTAFTVGDGFETIRGFLNNFTHVSSFRLKLCSNELAS